MRSNGNSVLTEKEIQKKQTKLEKVFTQMIETLGYDINDQQLQETPKRMAKMYVRELFQGSFIEEPKMTVFENTEHCDSMVFLGDISVKSTCSHHFIPFLGKAYIAYIPNEKVCGISKLARVVRWFMRRPQIQEEMTKQIADYIEEKLNPKGVAVYIEAQHLCMIARGVEEYNSVMKTSEVRGVFRDNSDARNEFFQMVKR
jgi:GTP cyclohydrolase IA